MSEIKKHKPARPVYLQTRFKPQGPKLARPAYLEARSEVYNEREAENVGTDLQGEGAGEAVLH